MKKKVGIIVVNWNSGVLTSLAIAPYLNYKSNSIICEVIVVDNASTDDSISLLKKYPIKIIANSNNKGFGHACNQAFDQLNTDYILLLNPDTQSSTDTLEGLTGFLDKNLNYAVTGPEQKNKNGDIIRCCGRFPTFKTALYEVLSLSKFFPKYFKPAPIMLDWDHSQSMDVDHIMGSYMLIRKNVIDIKGFMDKDYFVYWEDIDLSKRIYNKGFKSFYNNSYSILHEGGASGDKIAAIRLFYSISARRVYWAKHLGTPSKFILTLFSLTTEPLMRILKSPDQVKSIARAYILYLKKIINPKIL